MTVLLRGKKTPTQRAIAVLRRFGPDAHVYLPGVGMLNGLQAGNYLDSAGTTAATVDQPVGLVLDAAGGLGAELVTNGDFSAGAAGWTISGGGTLPTISAGQLVFSQTDGQYSFCRRDLNSALVAGKTYMVSVACTAYTGGTAQIVLFGGTVAATTIPVGINAFSFMFVAVSANTGVEVSRTASSTLVASFDNISVREVTGIAASQPTTANKSVLKLTNGRYNWLFDSTDLLTATYPAGYESVTVIDARSTGQATTAGANIVGAYSMGPSVTLYGRMVIKGALSASELALLQSYANRLAGL